MNPVFILLIVVFLPGILAAVFCDKVTRHSHWGWYRFTLLSFVLGLSCHLFLQLLLWVGALVWYLMQIIALQNPDLTFHTLGLWDALFSVSGLVNPNLPQWEILCAVLVSMPLAAVVTGLDSTRFVNRLFQGFGATSNIRDGELLSFYLDSPDINWIVLRDLKNDLIYQGVVWDFSESNGKQEIVLTAATVFRNDGKTTELYSAPSVYVAGSVGDFVVEAIPEDELVAEA